jgi:hypothetical protein
LIHDLFVGVSTANYGAANHLACCGKKPLFESNRPTDRYGVVALSWLQATTR